MLEIKRVHSDINKEVMNLSILDNLKQVKKELFDHLHPFANEGLSFRKTYITGYTMLLCVNGYPSEMAKNQLVKQMQMLQLPEDLIKQTIAQAQQAEQGLIHNILQILKAPEKKLVFMLDLYQYAQQDHKITEKEQELLLLFEELLQLSYAEVHFLRSFRIAMLRNKEDLASKAVQEALTQEVDVPLRALSYFMEGFIYEERLSSLTLLAGQKHKILHATLLEGEIIVEPGAELDLNGKTITFRHQGAIIVNGGKLKADNATFIATMDASETMLSLRNMADFTIQNAVFNGANNVRAMQVANTKVNLQDCIFKNGFHEARGGAIYFTDSAYFILQRCHFVNCSTLGKGGSLYIAGTEATHMRTKGFFGFRSNGTVQRVHVTMEDCTIAESRADKSGGVHIYEATAVFKNNDFNQCTSRRGGAAIDAHLCTISGENNTFINCSTGSEDAVVVYEGELASAQFGQFSDCSPQSFKEK